MFKPLPDSRAPEVRVIVDGRELLVSADLSVAAAVLAVKLQ